MIAAASRYFAAIFALGFMLGTVRTLLLAPAIGETPAVLLELPVMLVASAKLARYLLARYRITSAMRALGMGALALTLLLIAEALLARLLVGRSFGEWTASLVTVPGLIGLTGQFAFGAIPWLETLRSGRPVPAC